MILTNRGEVHTFGNHQNNQLGRSAPTADPENSLNTATAADDLIELRYPWHASPGPVPHVGQRYGRKATWVGASGDQTFLKIDESLVNSSSLSQSIVIANKNSIGKFYLLLYFIFKILSINAFLGGLWSIVLP